MMMLIQRYELNRLRAMYSRESTDCFLNLFKHKTKQDRRNIEWSSRWRVSYWQSSFHYSGIFQAYARKRKRVADKKGLSENGSPLRLLSYLPFDHFHRNPMGRHRQPHWSDGPYAGYTVRLSPSGTARGAIQIHRLSSGKARARVCF